jgi:hypothetical protein
MPAQHTYLLLWSPNSHGSEHTFRGRELLSPLFLATLRWEVFEFWVRCIIHIARIHRIFLGRCHKISFTIRGNHSIGNHCLRSLSESRWLISWTLVDISFVEAWVFIMKLLRKQIPLESIGFFPLNDESTTTIVVINFIECTRQVFYRIWDFGIFILHSYLRSCNMVVMSRQLLSLSLSFWVLSSSCTIHGIVSSVLLMLHDFHFPLKSWVEMIFNMIVSSAS